MKYVLYNHVGSGNHGCEALVRTIADIFGKDNTVLLSEAPLEEDEYGVSDCIKVYPAVTGYRSKLEFLRAFALLKFKNNYFPMDALPFQDAIRRFLDHDDVLVSIGGDIYCYENYPKYIALHKYARKFVRKTILLGCSIEPDVLSDEQLLDDLRSYDLISARESITFNALRQAGLENVIQCPDTAFGMSPVETALPEQFLPGNTIGLNISPLILKKSENASLILENYRRIIEYILKETDCAVALIPHVAWKNNNDSTPLKQLYQEFRNSNRICLIPDLPAPKIKYVISKCRCLVAARTHATIAAYSTCVPTLVLGYSVKSKGIAQDLFGTDADYVIDYKSITNDQTILNGLRWLMLNEANVKSTLLNKNRVIQKQLHALKYDIAEYFE